MSLPAKLGLSAITLSSLGGVSYLGITYFNKEESNQPVVEQKTKTISEFMNEKYIHTLLNTDSSVRGDDAHWSANWEKYKNDNSTKAKGLDNLKLPGWVLGNQTDLISELKTKCNTLASSTHNFSDYENVTKYCARPVTIKDQIVKEQLTAINTDGGDDIWSEVVKNKGGLTAHFDKLGIKAPDRGEITAKEIKAGCAKATEKNKSESDYDNIFNSYKEVCLSKSKA